MLYSNVNADKDIIYTLKRWLENKNNKICLSDHIIDCGYSNIGIVDASEIGRLLYGELKDTNVSVRWFIDKNAEGIVDIDGISVFLLNEIPILPKVDIVVISPIYDYEELKKYIARHDPSIRTVCLKDLVSEV